MSRLSRINTIWRKELVDTLRDRRTIVAMVLVPMVLYPVMMLGSLQAFELQVSQLVQEKYTVGVETEELRNWLLQVMTTDAARRVSPRPADDPAPDAPAAQPAESHGRGELVRSGVWDEPPPYDVIVVEDAAQQVADGSIHAAVLAQGGLPTGAGAASSKLMILFDASEIRSEIAATGIHGILERATSAMIAERLARVSLPPDFIRPIEVIERDVASAEKLAGSALGQIVPLILIIMTITGAIYPAIDLTAGERERGTLETLMAAPVPPIDLISGKFVVVALIGMLSAVLNLLAIGGTIYLGGVGDLLTRNSEFSFPLHAVPAVLLLLAPLAIMFSAILLAVCSFARSFKEAQNYVMPVMIAVLIPGVVGVLPGTRLEGPMLVMPVANIVVLTRELFLGRFDFIAIAGVALSTLVYAGAAVAVAARLFGQEAVLFADSASVRTLFQRRFFKPARVPTTAQVMLLFALAYPLSYFIQVQLARAPGLLGTLQHFVALAILLVLLYLLLPVGAAAYMRVNVPAALRLQPAPFWGWLAAGLLGASTWLLAMAWLPIQKVWLPMPPEMEQGMEAMLAWTSSTPVWVILVLLAIVPAVCEEIFFRGYMISGLRTTLPSWGVVLISSLAFAMSHYSVSRLPSTLVLGIIFAIVSLRSGSVWPGMLAHGLHNGLLLLAADPAILGARLEQAGVLRGGVPTPAWTWTAAALAVAATGFCLSKRPASNST